MRLIGHLQDESEAKTFTDYLYAEGISCQLESEKGGAWGIWVHEEDFVARSQALLRAFLVNSKDPIFQNATKQAEVLRAREEEQEKEASKRYFESEHIFRDTAGYGMGKVTAVLIGLSVAVYLVQIFGNDEWVQSWLLISNEYVGHQRLRLPEVRHGEVWRLVTPIFMHAKFPLHIFFNMLWLRELGTMVEARRSSFYLLGLVLALSVVPNVAQYWFRDPFFYGMSGVVYGLLGYVWMMSKFDPGSGFFIHPNTVVWMLVWFVVCFMPVMAGGVAVANYVHSAGLGIGVVWGYLSATRPFLGRWSGLA